MEVGVSGALRRAGEGEEIAAAAAAVGVMGVSVCDEGEMDQDLGKCGWKTWTGVWLCTAISEQDIMSRENSKNIVDVQHGDRRWQYKRVAQPISTLIFTLGPLIYTGLLSRRHSCLRNILVFRSLAFFAANGEAWLYPDAFASYSSVLSRGLAG